MRCAGNVAYMGQRKGAYRILVRKPEAKRPLGRPMCIWEIIIKWIFKKWEGDMNEINLAQDRVKCVEFLDFMDSNSFDCSCLSNIYVHQEFSFQKSSHQLLRF
jgi:hypothetical protein